jgi:hypothetical protein
MAAGPDGPIAYAGGGLLGDFVHQLSVVRENFLATGRKGRVYLSDHEPFRLGVERAYADLRAIVVSQDYVESFQLHAGEPFDVNLSTWRQSPLLYTTDWRRIFEDTFHVPWGAHKWLALPESECDGAILIGTTKWRPSLDWEFLKHLPGGATFVTDSQDELDHWRTVTQSDLPGRVFASLYELYQAIHGCRLFIGSLSAPLAAAMAAHRPCAYLRSHAVAPDVCDAMFVGLQEWWPHFKIVDREPAGELTALLERTSVTEA